MLAALFLVFTALAFLTCLTSCLAAIFTLVAGATAEVAAGVAGAVAATGVAAKEVNAAPVNTVAAIRVLKFNMVKTHS